MMMMDETRTTHIPSPFDKGDFVEYQGTSYQVIEFLGCRAEGLLYSGRSTVDHAVVIDIILPVVGKNHHQLSSTVGGEGYFQIMELNKDNVAILNPFSGERGEKKMKVWWEEDVEMIRDGLKEENKEVFCTVGKIMGKEVLGNIKILPKDPPIMKMPDLIMDMILFNLSPEDRLQCRLVTERWAFELFPINRFTTCSSLSLECGGSILVDFEPNPRSPCAKDMPWFEKEKIPLNSLQPLLNYSLLEHVENLYVVAKSRPEDDLHVILDQCRNVTHFDFSAEKAVATDSDWTWAKQFISTSKRLQSLVILNSYIREVNFADLHIAGSTSLNSLMISLSRKNSILRNLESLPCSITNLELRDLSVPLTKPEMLWIATNLTQLAFSELDVLHHHDADYSCSWENADEGDDENELDDNTIVEMMNRFPRLYRLQLNLISPPQQARYRCCDKACQINTCLEQRKGSCSNLSLSHWDGPYRNEVLIVTGSGTILM